MQLDLLQEVSALDDARNFATSSGRGWLTNFTCGALALKDRAIRERAERRVEDAVGRVRAADVLRDEAEERERSQTAFSNAVESAPVTVLRSRVLIASSAAGSM